LLRLINKTLLFVLQQTKPCPLFAQPNGLKRWNEIASGMKWRPKSPTMFLREERLASPEGECSRAKKKKKTQRLFFYGSPPNEVKKKRERAQLSPRPYCVAQLLPRAYWVAISFKKRFFWAGASFFSINA
jgi:hypothetical protein